MKKLTLCIKAKEGSFTFKYSNEGEETQQSVKELFTVFGDKEKNKHCYVMTTEIKERAKIYAFQQSKKLPFFNKFKSFIDSIPTGNAFITLNGEPKNLNEQMYYNFLIESVNETKDEKDIEGLIQTKYEGLPANIKAIIENYNFEVFSQNKISRIGEPNKNKRVCRFCLRSIATGATFKNKAHAISEGLGNKTILINEECDSCNEKFGSSIEQKLLLYFDLFRTLVGLKGKRGYRKLEFDECSLFYDGKVLNMKIKEGYDDVFTEVGEKQRIKLTYNHRLATINIYKALCKFALSVIPKEELSNFKKTIKWLNGDLEIKKLPRVLTSFSIDTNSDDNTPQIQLYFRKNDDLSYPYLVVDLTLNSSKTIFIVPACKKNDRDFISKLDKALVKKTFCINNRRWEEKEYDNYKISNFSQGYALEMSMMEKPPAGYE